MSPQERAWLARARALAGSARGRVSPNPPVGAVVARDGRVVGEGWHEGPGTPHAERVALAAAGALAAGATLVCTLEPCSHHGRTPPCTDAVLAADLARVVVGCRDPLERERVPSTLLAASGAPATRAPRRGGVELLRTAGVDVAVAEGPEGDACRELVGDFLTWALTGRPQVTLKLATSLDGRIATPAGESRWITGPPARALVHRWRADHDAVAVGIGTALADDPELTARDLIGPVRQPLRVVFDTAARLPPGSALARSAREHGVLVVAGDDVPVERVSALEAAGVEVLRLPGDRAARIAAALDALGARGAQSLLVEGGAGLAGALVAAGAVDRVAWLLAPILIGGTGAPGALGDPGLARLADAPRLLAPEVTRVGADVLVAGRLRPLPG